MKLLYLKSILGLGAGLISIFLLCGKPSQNEAIIQSNLPHRGKTLRDSTNSLWDEISENSFPTSSCDCPIMAITARPVKTWIPPHASMAVGLLVLSVKGPFHSGS